MGSRCASSMPCRALWGTFLQFSTVQGPLRYFPAVLLCPVSSARSPSSSPLSRVLCEVSQCPLRVLPSPLLRLRQPLSPFPVSLRCLSGVSPGLPSRSPTPFPRLRFSRRITSGNHRHAFQALLWHFPIFPTYNVRMKNGLSRTFSS